MTERCPHHPRTLGARVNACRECDREAAAARDRAKELAATVRDALRQAPRPPASREPERPDPTRDLARARARADQEARR